MCATRHYGNQRDYCGVETPEDSTDAMRHQEKQFRAVQGGSRQDDQFPQDLRLDILRPVIECGSSRVSLALHSRGAAWTSVRDSTSVPLYDGHRQTPPYACFVQLQETPLEDAFRLSKVRFSLLSD